MLMLRPEDVSGRRQLRDQVLLLGGGERGRDRRPHRHQRGRSLCTKHSAKPCTKPNAKAASSDLPHFTIISAESGSAAVISSSARVVATRGAVCAVRLSAAVRPSATNTAGQRPGAAGLRHRGWHGTRTPEHQPSPSCPSWTDPRPPSSCSAPVLSRSRSRPAIRTHTQTHSLSLSHATLTHPVLDRFSRVWTRVLSG